MQRSIPSIEARSGLVLATRAILLLIAALALSGCTNGPISKFSELGENANTRGFGRRFPHDPNENAFVFGVGDEVMIQVEEEPPGVFSGTQFIRQDGKITVPLVNDVIAGGLTTDQLRKKLENRIRLFMHNPNVTVTPGAVVSRRYYIGGQNPATGGTLLAAQPYVGDTTLFDVFVAMGSPSTILDDDCHVQVIRGDPRNPRVMVINVREMYTEGFTGGNIQIQPDDIITVPPTLLGRFNRLVAGLSIPFNNLFRVAAAYDRFRIITGDQNDFRRGGVFLY